MRLSGLLDMESRKTLLFCSVAWAVMLEALELVQMYYSPIYPVPLLRDRPWDWFNPWKTWCPGLGPSTTDFTRDYCYGTNVAHFGGPYSIMWYWTMYILSLGGAYYPLVNNLTIMVLINTVFMIKIRRQYPGYGLASLANPMYAWISVLFMAAWPQILLSLFLTTGSLFFKNWKVRVGLLLAAIAYRFPIGGPVYLWTFITHYSAMVVWNYIPYALTVAMWLFALSSLLRDNFKNGLVSRLPSLISVFSSFLVIGAFIGLWTFYSSAFGGNELAIASDWPLRIVYGVSLVAGLYGMTRFYESRHPHRKHNVGIAEDGYASEGFYCYDCGEWL